MTDDLTELENVGPQRADDLRAAGFETTVDVRSASIEELSEVDGIGEQLALAIKNEEPNLKNAGRDSKLAEYADDLLNAAKIPQTKTGIARDAGITRRALNNYLNEHPDFAAGFRRQRGRAEHALLFAAGGDNSLVNELVAEADCDRELDFDPKTAKWLLSRSYGYTEKQQVEVESDNTHRLEGDGFVVNFGGE